MSTVLTSWKDPGCRIVCRPERKEPRKWTVRDLQRIATFVEGGGVPWLTILAAIAVVGGFAALICAAAPRLRGLLAWYQNFRAFIIRPALLVAWIRAITVLVQLLEQFGVTIPPLLRPAVVAVIAILTVLLGFLTGLSDVDEDVAALQEFAETVDNLCNEAIGLGGIVNG